MVGVSSTGSAFLHTAVPACSIRTLRPCTGGRNTCRGECRRRIRAPHVVRGVDLTVVPGDVIGVVGANGAGKSILWRILAGDLDPLDGAVSIAPADAFVGWLPQEHERVAGESVAAYIARRTGCSQAAQVMDAAAAALAGPDLAAAPPGKNSRRANCLTVT